MKRMNIIGCAILLNVLSGTALAQTTTLHDPRLRDEDISGTQVNVSVQRLPSGIYEYRYDLVSPATNKGEISNFAVDAKCALDFGQINFQESSDPKFRIDASRDSQHVPLQVYHVEDATGQTLAGPASISFDDKIVWFLAMTPGDKVSGLRVLSPAPPGPRQYQLTVAMDTADLAPDGIGYDYSEELANDPATPWIQDFSVTGLITAPACAFAPPEAQPVFPGNGDESAAINNLLTYSAPLRDRFVVGPDVTTLAMTIHYSPDIDPKTFKVEPGWARKLFNPQPGQSETVVLPLDHKRDLFKLEVHTAKDQTPRKDNDLDFSFKDRDVFEIRHGDANPAGKGKGK